jgi:hypothetical protein
VARIDPGESAAVKLQGPHARGGAPGQHETGEHEEEDNAGIAVEKSPGVDDVIVVEVIGENQQCGQSLQAR